MSTPPASDAVLGAALPDSKKRMQRRAPAAVIAQRGGDKTTVHRRKREGTVDDIVGDNDGEPVEPGLQPLGPCPERWSKQKEYVESWNEVVRLSHKGVLTENDRIVVEVLATLLVVGRRAGWEQLSSAQFKQLEKCLAFLGMTPAHRSYVRPAFVPPGQKSPYDD